MRALLLGLTVLFGMHSGVHAADFKARYSDAGKRAKRNRSDFKLAKVEDYNKQALRENVAPIIYEAFALTYFDKVGGLDFKFPKLSQEQFDVLKTMYGGFSQVNYQTGKGYRLVDFLPPAIQAIEGHVTYLGMNEKATTIGQTAEGLPIKADVRTCPVCWASAYAVVESTSRPESALEFSVFDTGRIEALEVFNQYGTKIESIDYSRNFRIANAKVGDLILYITNVTVYDRVESYANGEIRDKSGAHPIDLLQHVAMYIDEGLVFERPGGGQQDPYRLVSLNESVGPYRIGKNSIHNSLQFQVMRFENGLPPAAATFTEVSPVNDKARLRSIPVESVGKATIGTEIMFPANQFFTTYSTFHSVPLELDSMGRASLPSAIYKVGYLDFGRISCRLLFNE